MARKKVKLAFISNDSQRKATFNKRKRGLIKKVTELSTLCDVNACAIIYSPYDANPEVWPSIEGARRIVDEFKALPEMDQNKKMVDQEAHLRQRMEKTKDNVKKLKKDSKELRLTEILSQSFMGNFMLHNMNVSDLNDLGYLIDQFSRNVIRNIEIRHESGIEMGESSNVAAASEGIASAMVMASTMAPMAPIQEVGGSSSSSAAFYRPQFHYPPAPYVEQLQNLNLSTTAPMATNHEVGSSSTSAAFYRPSQQQPQFQYHPLAPYVGQPQNFNMILNQNQQQRFMEMMNHQYTQVSYAAEQLGFPFMDHQQHQSQPHQPTTGDSTASAAPSPSHVVSTTNPNPTNNI